MKTLNDKQVEELFGLMKHSDSVELKLTVADLAIRSTADALGMDPLEAEIRQVVFFDTPALTLSKAGVVVRARRIQGGDGDTVIKLRPVNPETLPPEVRQSTSVKVEVDTMPTGFVCSASMKGKTTADDVRAVVRQKMKIRDLFTKDQRAFYKAHAPGGLKLSELSVLGPINLMKLQFEPDGLKRRFVAELWMYPDGSRILELSTKASHEDAFDVAAATRAFLQTKGLDLTAEQQPKTNRALKHFTDLLKRVGATTAALTAVLFSAGYALAQGNLTVGEAVEVAIAAGSADEYTIALDAGDYVAGAVDQRGITVLAAVFTPDGSRLRNFGGPRDGKRTLAFIADSAGTYRLELRAPSVEEAAELGGSQAEKGTYELKLLERLSFEERMKPQPQQDRYTSPAIETLRTQLAAGDRSTESFWERVGQSGTPLVEPIEDDEKRTRVTFLWRGTPETRNVMVLGSFMTGPPTDYAMTRLADTDVWYLTVRLPSGSRFAYALSPNDPQAFGPPRGAQRAATVQGDPLNPRRWGCFQPNATRHDCQSMVELPGAPPQPWIVRNESIPAGKVDKHKIVSTLLKNERNLSVYTPPGYVASGGPYALLVLFDEGAYLNNVPTPVILDNLIAAGKIPPMVAVLIANPSQETRGRELPPNPQFADFLATELLPWVHARYRVTSDPKLTTVGGSSYGGIAATYAGLRHSQLFGNVLCQSGSFWWAPERVGPDADATTETGWLAKEFLKSPKLPLKFWMDAGVFEVDSRGSGGAILEPSRHMRDVLLAKGYEVHYQQFNSGHDYLNWRGTLADGLIALVGTGSERRPSR